MRVRAKHWVNYGGEWYEAGKVFDAAEQDADMLTDFCEVEPDELGKPESAPEQIEPAAEETPKRRGRPRKSE